jgi:hypothetical protein
MTSLRRRASPPLLAAPSRAACSSSEMPAPPTSTGRPGARLLDGPHDRPHRPVVVPRRHGDRDGQRARRLGDGGPERVGRDVGTEVDDVVALSTQHVRRHGGGKRVQLVWRGPQDDASSPRASFGEAGPEPGHHPRRHTRGAVLVVHAVVARFPPLPHRAHGQAQLVEQDLVWVGPRSQAPLDDGPRSRLVSCDEPVFEPARRRLPRRPSRGRARAPGHRRSRAHARQVPPVDEPVRADLGGRQTARADVAVGRHVVDSEPVRDLLQVQQSCAGTWAHVPAGFRTIY